MHSSRAYFLTFLFYATLGPITPPPSVAGVAFKARAVTVVLTEIMSGIAAGAFCWPLPYIATIPAHLRRLHAERCLTPRHALPSSPGLRGLPEAAEEEEEAPAK
jgi:hypothetical protein